jgi:hypothetical protein
MAPFSCALSKCLSHWLCRVAAHLAFEEQINKNTKQNTKCQAVVSLPSKMTPSFTIYGGETNVSI